MEPAWTPEQALNAAVEHYKAGRSAQVEPFCHLVLAAEPGHPGALHLLGVLAFQRGSYDEAVELVLRALAAAPAAPALHSTLGEALRRLGRVDEAIASQRRAIELDPTGAQPHNNLGVALEHKGLLAEAVLSYERSVELFAGDPVAQQNLRTAREKMAMAAQARTSFAEAQVGLGATLARAGQLAEAIELYERALELAPDHAEALSRLGAAQATLGRLESALVAWNRLLALRPGNTEIHFEVASAYSKLERWDEAAAAYTKAIELTPHHAEAYLRLAAVLARADKLLPARQALEAAVSLDPGSAGAHYQLGRACERLGERVRAIREWEAALRLDPGFPDAQESRARALLAQGDFEIGWEALERRWEPSRAALLGVREAGVPAEASGRVPYPDLAEPRWEGERATGKTILLHSLRSIQSAHAEQSLGDTLLLARYARLVAARGGRVVLAAQPPLKRILGNVPGVSRVVAAGEPLGAFDLQCPLLSLPRVFKTNAKSIPGGAPYVTADARLVETWRQKLAPHARSFRVGLVWAARPDDPGDRGRSCALDVLAPLRGVDGVVYVALEKSLAASRAKTPPLGLALVDGGLTDLSEAAALIETLDLLISVDAAPAHLAGAMAKPVWTMLPFSPSFPWLLRGDTSAWYPTMRLFRQPSPGDYASVVKRIAEELRPLVERTLAASLR